MLIDKINKTQDIIECWVDSWGIDEVYIAFSGGIDSRVLLHIARQMYPNIRAMFNNTGLELPEIVSFVKSFDHVDIVRPKISFNKVIEKYGWPVISKEQSQFINEFRRTKSNKLRNLRWFGRSTGRSKISNKWREVALFAPFKISHKCCDKLKKDPAKRYEKETGRNPILGVMAAESQLRRQSTNCNLYDAKRPISKPILHWEQSDIWEYIQSFNINYCSVYDMGWERTGCAFCIYGVHYDNPNKFQLMSKTHPKLHKYIIEKLGAGDVLDFLNIPYNGEDNESCI